MISSWMPLLGSGLARPVKGEFAAAIRCMNTHRAPVLSVDVPSGLDADRGVPLGDAVTAPGNHYIRRNETGLDHRGRQATLGQDLLQ